MRLVPFFMVPIALTMACAQACQHGSRAPADVPASKAAKTATAAASLGTSETPPIPPVPLLARPLPPPGPRANLSSPLGTNLTGITDWSPEWAFADAFKTSRPWISGVEGSWDDGRALDTDARGWLKRLEPNQVARTLLFWHPAIRYPAGDYVVRYDGDGILQYWHNGKLRDSSPGRQVIEVDPTKGGIGINVVSVNPTNPIRNLHILMPGGACEGDPMRACRRDADCAPSFCATFERIHEKQRFHPTFLKSIERYSVLRFMDWMDTNHSKQRWWKERPLIEDARWSVKGVPVEVMVELANLTGADPWFNIPHLADDDYVRRFAELVKASLDPTRKVYVEWSNEVWNPMFAQSAYAREQGLALKLAKNDTEANLRFYARRSVQVFAIWEEVFGGRERLVRVLASQAVNPWITENILGFEKAYAHADAIAIAPYFGYHLGDPEHAAANAKKTDGELIAELLESGLDAPASWVEKHAALAAKYKLKLIAYEGGQSLVGVGPVVENEALNARFDAINRDARMREVYAKYLGLWKKNGGELFVHFVNCSTFGKFGRWGAMENLDQPRSTAPKLDALWTFIDENPRWW